MSAVASEALLIRRRSAPYLVAGAWSLMVVAFAFVVPYVVYLTLDPSTPDRAQLLDVVLPGQVHSTAVSSFPLFGGAIFLILGVILVGSENRWGTWKVRFTQGPSRQQVITAKFVVGSLAAIGIVIVAFLAAVIASLSLALIAGEAVSLPSPGSLLNSVLAASILAVVWTSVGMALATITQGTSVALAVGLMWTLALENSISGLAAMLPALEPLRYALLSTASGSLVGSLGAPTQGEGGTPGVVDILSGPVAVTVLLGYLAVSMGVSVWLARRRDVP